MRVLGCKNIKNTLIYITLESSLFQTKDDQFHVAVAKALDETCKLLEVDFEYIYDVGDPKLFRKHK